MKVFRLYNKIFRSYIMVVIVYVVVFLGIALAITSSLEDTNNSFTETKMNVYLKNLDEGSSLSKGLVDYLEKFAIYKEVDEKDIDDALHFRQVSAIIVIPENFQNDFFENRELKIEVESIDQSATSIAITNGIDNYLNYIRVYSEQTGKDLNEVMAMVHQTLNMEAETTILSEESDELYNISFYFNNLSYILNAIILTVVGLITISFRKLQVRRRLIVSPYSIKKSNLEMIFGNLLFTLSLIILFGGVSFLLAPNVMMSVNGVLHLVNTLVFALAALSMSFFLSLLIKNEEVLAGVNNVFSLGAAFLTGAFVPQALLSDGMLKFAHILPNYYFVYNSNLISSTYNFKSSDISNIMLYLLIQILFAGLFVILSLVLSRRQAKSES